MLKAIDESFMIYKKEMEKYRKWTKSIGVEKDEDVYKKNLIDRRRLYHWNALIDGMRKVIGLSEQEIKMVELMLGVRLYDYFELDVGVQKIKRDISEPKENRNITSNSLEKTTDLE